MKATEADKEALKVIKKRNPQGEFTASSVIGWGVRRPTYRLRRLAKLGMIEKRIEVSDYRPDLLAITSVYYSLSK